MRNYLAIFAFCLAGITAFGQELRSAPTSGAISNVYIAYPNPATATITIQAPTSSLGGVYHVQIYTLQGTLVEDIVLPAGTSYVANVDNREDGIYIIAIVDDNDYGRGSGRLVKRR